MKIEDLGELTGPVLVFGGPYSNSHATQALIAQAEARGIAPQNVICTGDVVAYCGAPAETVAQIRDFGCAVVAGNCEQQLAQGAADCGCGFAAGTACDLASGAWYAYASGQIGAADRGWMADLPDLAVFSLDGRRYGVLHGGATDVARFLWPSSDAAAFQQEIDAVQAALGPVDGVIAGHCGVAFARDIGSVRWINAGVIGMPPHDGRPETRFATLSDHQPVFHRLAYDHAAQSRAMEQAGLVQGYHHSLRSGIWPNEDILPPELCHGGPAGR